MMMAVMMVMMMIGMMMTVMTNPPSSSEHPKDSADEQITPEGEGGVVAHSFLNVNISGC